MAAGTGSGTNGHVPRRAPSAIIPRRAPRDDATHTRATIPRRTPRDDPSITSRREAAAHTRHAHTNPTPETREVKKLMAEGRARVAARVADPEGVREPSATPRGPWARAVGQWTTLRRRGLVELWGPWARAVCHCHWTTLNEQLPCGDGPRVLRAVGCAEILTKHRGCRDFFSFFTLPWLFFPKRFFLPHLAPRAHLDSSSMMMMSLRGLVSGPARGRPQGLMASLRCVPLLI